VMLIVCGVKERPCQALMHQMYSCPQAGICFAQLHVG
jgi:hypothetical protein